MSDRVVKSVVYRKFRPVDGSLIDQSLQELVTAALGSVGKNDLKLIDDWTARRFIIRELPDHFRFSYALEGSDGALSGMLCMYSPNEQLAVIREGKNSENGKKEEHISLAEALKQINVTEDQMPEGDNHLKGHNYFLIRGNHVFVVQHISLRTAALEQYLHDLLWSTGVINKSDSFVLDGVLSLPADGSSIGDVLAVEIGGVMAHPTGPALPVVTEAEHHEELARARPSEGKGKEILDLMFGTARADKIMDSMPPEAELEVDVRFGFKARKRKISRAALAQIATAARDLPEGQVRAIGRDGNVKGGDLRLQTDMPFKRIKPNGALLDVDDARAQLLKVYERFVQDGKIEP